MDHFLRELETYENRLRNPGEGTRALAIDAAVQLEKIAPFRALAAAGPAALERTRWAGHLTASALVIDPQGRVLLTHHRKLGIWLQLGGHCDGDPNIAAVARKEAEEESGLTDLEFALDGIFDLDVHEIPAHREVPAHLHYDVRYLFRTEHPAAIQISEESNDLRWFDVEAANARTQEWATQRLFEKARAFLTPPPATKASTRLFAPLMFLLAWLLTACPASRPGGGEHTGGAELSGTKFLTFGDWGTGDQDQKNVAAGIRQYCQRKGCEFAVLLGDNFYPTGVQTANDPQWKTKFEDIYRGLDFIFYVSLGNHDHYGRHPEAQIEYGKTHPNWYFPAYTYSVVRGPITFIALDTEKWNAAQGTWLKGELDRATTPWKIVFGHHPIFSYGAHGDTPALVRELLPILRGRANLYLAGHEHDRQILKPDTGLNFVISGGGGAPRRATRIGARTVFASDQYGFTHITANETSLWVRMVRSNAQEDAPPFEIRK